MTYNVFGGTLNPTLLTLSIYIYIYIYVYACNLTMKMCVDLRG